MRDVTNQGGVWSQYPRGTSDHSWLCCKCLPSLVCTSLGPLWACFFSISKVDLLAGLPVVRPAYTDPNLSNYVALPEPRARRGTRPLLLQPFATGAVCGPCRGREIATHTFSHYYCLEPGLTPEAFRHDLEAAVAAAARLGPRASQPGISPQSIQRRLLKHLPASGHQQLPRQRGGVDVSEAKRRRPNALAAGPLACSMPTCPYRVPIATTPPFWPGLSRSTSQPVGS